MGDGGSADGGRAMAWLPGVALAGALAVVAVILAEWIGVALAFVSLLSGLLDLSPRLGSLVAAGTSICGITAIVAVAPVIGARDDETSYAVATIALVGMLTLFVYPFLANSLFESRMQAGLFLGYRRRDPGGDSGDGSRRAPLVRAAEIGLLLAMAAVGLGTRLRSLYALGLRPLTVGFAAAVSVRAVSAVLIHLFVAPSLPMTGALVP